MSEWVLGQPIGAEVIDTVDHLRPEVRARVPRRPLRAKVIDGVYQQRARDLLPAGGES